MTFWLFRALFHKRDSFFAIPYPATQDDSWVSLVRPSGYVAVQSRGTHARDIAAAIAQAEQVKLSGTVSDSRLVVAAS